MHSHKNEEKTPSVLAFENVENLKQFVGKLPDYLAVLLKIISPIPIEVVLNQYQDDQVIDQFVATIGYQPPNQEKIIASTSDILPTRIDCTDFGVVKILRPGVISYYDLKLLLPRKIFLVKDYFTHQYLDNLDIFRVNSKPNIRSKSVILGTKESLKKEFDLWFLKHFCVYRKDNLVLINIGSQTNPENIIKQLGKNLSLAEKERVKYIYFLNQTWPQSQWGEILRFVISNISRPLPEKARRGRQEKIDSVALELENTNLVFER